MITPDTYIVICRDDTSPDGTKGDFVLATRRVFQTQADADDYAVTIALGREPMVVAGRWTELRGAHRRLATIVIPEGYASAAEFAQDCGFELIDYFTESLRVLESWVASRKARDNDDQP